MVKRFISALACFACVVTGGIALSACGKKATVVESEEQFIEAVAKGGSIQLGKDISLSKALTISKDVTIDLNNKNISETYNYDKSKNDSTSMFHVVEGGSLTVKGGKYKIENSTHPEYIKYMLNLNDENGHAGKAKIEVTGGSFTGYDPADSRSEDPAVSFVKQGYESKVQDGVYTVTKK